MAFDDGDLHLKVSVATAGDLLSAMLTDIGEVKRREASFRLMFEHNPGADVGLRSRQPGNPRRQ